MSTKGNNRKLDEIELCDEEEPGMSNTSGLDDLTNVSTVNGDNVSDPGLNLADITKAVNESMTKSFSKLVEIFDGNVTLESLGEDLKLEDDKIYEEELWMAFVR